MNKIIALIIILTLSIGVVGCGSSDSKEKAVASKEELLVSATKLTADQLLNEIGGNKAKAKNYIGNIYCITGHVLEIEEDYVLVLAADTGDWNNVIHSDDWYAYAELAMLRVYLSPEELGSLEKCENIQVVGALSDTGTFTYAKIEPLYLDITNAYLIETNVEYQGRYRLQ